MGPEDLRDMLRVRPFQPFRLFLTDGAQVDVRHPDMVMPTRRTAIVGMEPADSIPDRVMTISFLHIVRVEPIGVPAKGNGQEG